MHAASSIADPLEGKSVLDKLWFQVSHHSFESGAIGLVHAFESERPRPSL
jgi:hypothetical protein